MPPHAVFAICIVCSYSGNIPFTFWLYHWLYTAQIIAQGEFHCTLHTMGEKSINALWSSSG